MDLVMDNSKCWTRESVGFSGDIFIEFYSIGYPCFARDDLEVYA